MRLGLVLFLAGNAFAQPSPSPSPDAAEIERALREDMEAQKKSAPAAAAAAPTTSSSSAWSRMIQSLNPDISAIIDFSPGYYSDENVRKSGDDPAATGFNVQELELAFQANVDPYFRADIFLTVPNLSGLEVEEAFVTTSHIPGNLQLKAGIFRAQMGRQNTQHLHLQDFTRRPGINYTFLGPDGLRAPGVELNFLVPKIPFYLLIGVSAFSVGAAEPDQPVATFGGGARWNFTYLGFLKAFFNLNDSTSLYPGFSVAFGNTSQAQTLNFSPSSPACSTQLPLSGPIKTACDNFYDMLYGFDLYLKWKPPNQAKSYASVAWQTEYFLRHIPELKVNGLVKPQAEGGMYTQLVVQFARRWFAGIRGELMGAPSGALVRREYAGALSLTCQLSEFARVRLYGEVRVPQNADVNGAAFVQLEASIGAHGAHPF
jgi:hypothetical protein